MLSVYDREAMSGLINTKDDNSGFWYCSPPWRNKSQEQDALLYFFFWPLCCLFFFDIRIMIAPQSKYHAKIDILMITPLASSNSSYLETVTIIS
jgi:hypothetical protein